MNIGIFTDCYKPRINGVVASTIIFSNEFRALGHNAYIFAPSYPGYIDEEKDIFRYRSFYLFFDPEDRLALPNQKEVERDIRRTKIDVLHTQTPFSMGILGANLAKKYHLPLIHTYHTFFAEYISKYLPVSKYAGRAFARFASRWYCNKCNLVITPSQAMKEVLQSYDISAQIEVVPTGVNIGQFKNARPQDFRSKFGLLPQEKILIYVGRVGYEKNIDFLVKAFAKINREISQARLVIVGDGKARKDLTKLSAELEIKDKVLFTGYISEEDWVNAYAAADIFAFSSLTETQGLVLLESMAAGTPVVAVKAMGVSEVLGDNKGGFLTELSIEDFSEKAVKLLSDDNLREEKSKEAIQRAEEMSTRSLALKMLSLYQSLLQR